MFLKGCLNGSRSKADHPRCPITPVELAADADAVVVAGVRAVHVHPRDEAGKETLEASSVASALDAVRARVTVPIGVSTGAWFLPETTDRLRAIRAWTVLPDFASVNFHEPGAADVARLLLDRGIAVEAGLWNLKAAEALMQADLGRVCLRLLFEPMEQTVDGALANLAGMEAVTHEVSESIPRLLHGDGSTAWPLLREAQRRGYQGRIGLEDTLLGPNGAPTGGNAALVLAALKIIRAE